MIMRLSSNSILIMLTLVLVNRVSSECNFGEVHLINGSVPSEGIVEVCVRREWSSVCAAVLAAPSSTNYIPSWGHNQATIVCRQLGYEGPIAGTHQLPSLYRSQFQPTHRSYAFRNINCNIGTETTLLECSFSASYDTNNCYHARVRCKDSQRVKNFIATLTVNRVGTTTRSVEITWEQNMTVRAPSTFEVTCYNDMYGHSIKMIVSNDTTSTELGGLLHSSNYTCCVSAVYDDYTARGVCTEVKTPTNHEPPPGTDSDSGESPTDSEGCVRTDSLTPTETQVSSTSITLADSRLATACTDTNLASIIIIGGVLGSTILLLLILLAILFVCLFRPDLRKKVFSTKQSLSSPNSSTQRQKNRTKFVITPNQMSNSAIEQCQFENDIATDQGVSNPNYSGIDPAYESLSHSAGRQQRQDGGRRREIPISERYEFAEIHADTDRRVQVGVSASDHEYEVTKESVLITGDEEYSHLQY